MYSKYIEKLHEDFKEWSFKLLEDHPILEIDVSGPVDLSLDMGSQNIKFSFLIRIKNLSDKVFDKEIYKSIKKDVNSMINHFYDS
jgi:hypothetical protein